MKYSINNIIDRIFILIVVFCLFFTAFNFKEKNIETKESRYISQKPILIDEYGINIEYPKQLEDYFNDRFYFRYQAINLNKNLRYFLTQNLYQSGNTVLDKKNNVIYNDSFFGIPRITLDHTNTTTLNLQKINNFCKSNNIKFYIVIVPRRADFIKYNTFDIKKKYPQKYKDYITDIIDNIKNKTDINVIYPYEEMLKENKENLVYYKTDHHWTDSGAFITYQKLMNEIKKSYPDFQFLSKKDFNLSYNKKVSHILGGQFHSGTMLRNTGVSDVIINKILDYKYLYFEHPDKKKLKIQKKAQILKNSQKYGFHYMYSNGYDKKVIILGDSFVFAFVKFLPFTFKDLLVYINTSMSYSEFKDTIKEYKPDILIILIRSYDTGIINNLYGIKEEK